MVALALQSRFDAIDTAPQTGTPPHFPSAFGTLGIACVATGTPVDADGGAIPVDDLLPGHRVWTCNAGMRAVLHRVRFRVDPELLDLHDELQPFCVSPGAFGDGSPANAIVLAAQHRLFVQAPAHQRREKRPKVLVTARRLSRMSKVHPVPAGQPIDYVALLLDGTHRLCIGGLPCEAFPATSDAMDQVFGLPMSARPALDTKRQ